MSHFTFEHALNKETGIIQVDYGTDLALGYWMQIWVSSDRDTPAIEIDEFFGEQIRKTATPALIAYARKFFLAMRVNHLPFTFGSGKMIPVID